jgi:hypothetical protein
VPWIGWKSHCKKELNPSGAQEQIFIPVRQLLVYWCGVLSLTRGRVCRLQLLLVPASAVIIGSESRGTRDHILLSQIRDSPNLEGQVLLFIISHTNRVARLELQALATLFVASYNSQGYGGGIRNWSSQSQNYLTIGGLPPISSSWCQAPWDPRPGFFSQLNSCDNSPYITSLLTRIWVLSLMNVFGLLSGVLMAHIACYWKFFLLPYTQVLCQSRFYIANHVYLTYGEVINLITFKITPRRRRHRKHRSSIIPYVFVSRGMY